jgi:hypothetical protein
MTRSLFSVPGSRQQLGIAPLVTEVKIPTVIMLAGGSINVEFTLHAAHQLHAQTAVDEHCRLARHPVNEEWIRAPLPNPDFAPFCNVSGMPNPIP